jgi:inosine-uridine nucleoside N-ribohydrolase
MPKKVILDTDPGVDDASALLLLHRHPEIDLVGITTVFGNATCADTTRNALYLKARFGIDAPVARGAACALDGRTSPPPTMVHGDNGLGNVDLSGVTLGHEAPVSAPQLIIDLVRAHPGEITLLAVGRMTNLAMALALAPDIAGLVKQVVIMGGAFGLAGANGNVSPVAEANIIGDPQAADIVFGAAWDVVAIGLDVTRQVLMTGEDVEALAASDDDGARFVAAISRHYMTYYSRYGMNGFFVHDASAAAYVIDPGLFETRDGPVRVATDGVARGQTIQRDLGHWYPPGPWDDRSEQTVCTGVRGDAVRRLLLSSLLGA